MRIFISTGEPSGDLHAANLVRSLRRVMPEAEFVGFGGPKLARAGCQVMYPLVDLAVMWFFEVIGLIGTFVKLLNQADRYFAENKPDLLILIDYPGFHWHLARRAKKHGIPVVYYVPPQLWAWASWRIRKVKRNMDLLLCSLPFEPEWYRDRGYDTAEFHGHPYFDELQHRVLDDGFLADQQSEANPSIVLLPGSRTKELVRNLPAMYRAAAKLAAQRPDVRIFVSCLHRKHADIALETATELYEKAKASGTLATNPTIDPERLELFAGRTPELIRLADLAWAVSGSVSLELMNEGLPTVILYTIRQRDRIVVKLLKRAKYITLVNLIAGEMAMPEYLTHKDASDELCDWALKWLNEPAERDAASRQLLAVRAKVGQPGASDRAAVRIAEFLQYQPKTSIYRGPHDRRRIARPGLIEDEGESPDAMSY